MDVRTSAAAAAENSPRRSGLLIRGGRGTPATCGRGEPHPTLMRTPAARPRKAERLCQGTGPGRSRYSSVPSSAAIQKATGSLLERSVPLGTAGADRPGERSSDHRSRSGGGREDLGMANSQARYTWDSVTLIPLVPRPTGGSRPLLRPPQSKEADAAGVPSKRPDAWAVPDPTGGVNAPLVAWGHRAGWPTTAPVRPRLAGRAVAQCRRNLSILKTSFLWSM